MLEDQVNEVNAEIAQVKLNTDRQKDESRKVKDETAAIKKVSEWRVTTLCATTVTLLCLYCFVVVQSRSLHKPFSVINTYHFIGSDLQIGCVYLQVAY